MTHSPPHIIYCHGTPGGPGEWQFFAPPRLRARGAAIDRNTPAEGDSAARFDRIAAQLQRSYPGAALHLIGFSLGAYAALNIAARLPDQVCAMDLIAPAAPLELGNFLPATAGRMLFELARDHPRLFGMAARAQGLAARTAPLLLFNRLFASTAGADRALAADPAFRAAMVHVLRQGLAVTPAGFAAEIRGYVQDWSTLPGQITAPVTLWHGTADNWSPPQMSTALAQTLPKVAGHHSLPGLSHYTALRHALAQIAP